MFVSTFIGAGIDFGGVGICQYKSTPKWGFVSLPKPEICKSNNIQGLIEVFRDCYIKYSIVPLNINVSFLSAEWVHYLIPLIQMLNALPNLRLTKVILIKQYV